MRACVTFCGHGLSLGFGAAVCWLVVAIGRGGTLGTMHALWSSFVGFAFDYRQDWQAHRSSEHWRSFCAVVVVGSLPSLSVAYGGRWGILAGLALGFFGLIYAPESSLTSYLFLSCFLCLP